MVFGFMRQSGGAVRLDSVVGRGTRVHMYLPQSVDQPPARARPATEPLRTGSGQRILVVEDNDALRKSVVLLLRALKYTVTEAGDTDAAVEVLKREQFDLVFSDVVMPGAMDGVELSRLIALNWPDTRVLLTSGYTPVADEWAAQTGTRPRLLPKPYKVEELADLISDVLAGRS